MTVENNDVFNIDPKWKAREYFEQKALFDAFIVERDAKITSILDDIRFNARFASVKLTKTNEKRILVDFCIEEIEKNLSMLRTLHDECM